MLAWQWGQFKNSFRCSSTFWVLFPPSSACMAALGLSGFTNNLSATYTHFSWLSTIRLLRFPRGWKSSLPINLPHLPVLDTSPCNYCPMPLRVYVSSQLCAFPRSSLPSFSKSLQARPSAVQPPFPRVQLSPWSLFRSCLCSFSLMCIPHKPGRRIFCLLPESILSSLPSPQPPPIGRDTRLHLSLQLLLFPTPLPIPPFLCLSLCFSQYISLSTFVSLFLSMFLFPNFH